MRCEQVFETLCQIDAGAPVTPALSGHLASCQQCAQLAAQLTPAVDALQEAASIPGASMESSQLAAAPWLNGEAPDALPVTQQTPPAVVKPRRKSSAGWPGKDFWQVTTLALLVALAFTAFQLRGHGTSHREVTPTNLAKYQPDAAGRATLAAMKLPADCLASDPSQRFFAAQGGAMLQCCTSCHTAAVDQPAAVNLVAVLQKSCQACHISQ